MTEPRPRLALAAGTPQGNPIAEFATAHIAEGEEFIEFEVVYLGFESAPDILRVNRVGEVVAARSAVDA